MTCESHFAFSFSFGGSAAGLAAVGLRDQRKKPLDQKKVARLDDNKSIDPDGIRTRVAGVKGQCPRPLDDGAGDIYYKR